MSGDNNELFHVGKIVGLFVFAAHGKMDGERDQIPRIPSTADT